jgi:hypothetical protein
LRDCFCLILSSKKGIGGGDSKRTEITVHAYNKMTRSDAATVQLVKTSCLDARHTSWVGLHYFCLKIPKRNVCSALPVEKFVSIMHILHPFIAAPRIRNNQTACNSSIHFTSIAEEWDTLAPLSQPMCSLLFSAAKSSHIAAQAAPGYKIFGHFLGQNCSVSKRESTNYFLFYAQLLHEWKGGQLLLRWPCRLLRGAFVRMDMGSTSCWSLVSFGAPPVSQFNVSSAASFSASFLFAHGSQRTACH